MSHPIDTCPHCKKGVKDSEGNIHCPDAKTPDECEWHQDRVHLTVEPIFDIDSEYIRRSDILDLNDF